MFSRLRTFCENYAQTSTSSCTKDRDRLRVYQLYGKTCAAVANYYGVPATPLLDADAVAENAKRIDESPEIKAQYELFSQRLGLNVHPEALKTCSVPHRTDAYMRFLQQACEDTNCFAMRGSGHMLRNVTYAIFMSFVTSQSCPQARPIGICYDDDDDDDDFKNPQRYQNVRYGLPIVTTRPSDMEYYVEYQRPSFLMSSSISSNTKCKDSGRNSPTEEARMLLTGDQPPPYIPSYMPTNATNASSHRRYNEIPVFANDVLMQECFSQVHECMARLSALMGTMDWRAPPRDARTIEAWNTLLRLDGTYIEPHMPSDVELRRFRDEEKMCYTDRIRARVKAMAVQKLNKRDGDVFSSTPMIQWSARLMMRNHVYTLFSKLRGETHNAENVRTYMRQKDHDTAIAMDADWNLSLRGSKTTTTRYAPYGLGMVVSTNVSDEEAMKCTDTRRMLGRVATYLFLAMHAVHVRSLDIRTSGVIMPADMPIGQKRFVLSALLLKGLRLCTQIRVLRGSEKEVVSICAASLATTVNIVEVHVRGIIFLRGHDVGAFACPYASSGISKSTSASASGLEYMWLDRICNRHANATDNWKSTEPLKLESLCVPTQPGNLILPHAAYIMTNCDPSMLRRVEIGSLVDKSAPEFLGMLLQKEMPVLNVLRVYGVNTMTEADYIHAAEIIAKRAPNLVMCGIMEVQGINNNNAPLVSCLPIAEFVRKLPETVVTVELNKIPANDRGALVEAMLQRKNKFRILHLPSGNLRDDVLDALKRANKASSSVDFRCRTSNIGNHNRVGVDEIVSSCSGHVSEPVEMRFLLGAPSLAKKLRLTALDLSVSEGESALVIKQKFEALCTILDSEELQGILESICICAAPSRANVRDSDTVPMRAPPSGLNGYLEFSADDLYMLEDALIRSMLGSRTAANLRHLKLLYVMSPKWASFPSLLGSWVARHGNLCSLALWDSTPWQLEDACVNIMSHGGPPTTLVDFSITPHVNETPTVAMVVRQVMRNRTELRRAVAKVIEHEVKIQEEQDRQRKEPQQQQQNEEEDDIVSPELRASIDAVLSKLDNDLLLAEEEMLPPTDDDDDDEDKENMEDGGQYRLGRDRLFPIVKPPKPEFYNDSNDCLNWESWDVMIGPVTPAEQPSDWSWLSFLVYRKHPYMQEMLRTHTWGSALTKAELRSKIEDVLLQNSYNYKAFQVAVNAIAAENKTETSENGESLHTHSPIPQFILNAMDKLLNVDSSTSSTAAEQQRRLMSKRLCDTVAATQKSKMPRLADDGMDIGLSVMAELAVAAERTAPVDPANVFGMYGHIWSKIARSTDFSATLKRGIAAAAAPLSMRANIAEADDVLKRYMLYALTAHGRVYGVEHGICYDHMNHELLSLAAFRESDIYTSLTRGLKELVKCATWTDTTAQDLAAVAVAAEAAAAAAPDDPDAAEAAVLAAAAAAAAAAEEPPKRPPHEALFELGEHMVTYPQSENECAFALQAVLYSDLPMFGAFVTRGCSYGELPHISQLHYTSYNAERRWRRRHVSIHNPIERVYTRYKEQLHCRMEEELRGHTKLYRRIESFYQKLTCYCMQCTCAPLHPIRYGSTNC